MLFIYSQDIEQKPYSDIIKSRGLLCCKFAKKTNIYNPSLDLVNDVYTIFGKILMSIKARYSVTNLGKTTIYNPKVDIVNDNVYT